MKLTNIYLLFLITIVVTNSQAQSIKTRSNEFVIDLNSNQGDGDVPLIKWIEPIPEINFVQEGKFKLKAEFKGSTAIKNITISIIDIKDGVNRAKQVLIPEEGQENYFLIDKQIYLAKGSLKIELAVENIAGITTKIIKKVYVGDEAIASVSTLDRKDYALFFAIDEYDNWSNLVNPVYDARTIAENLDKNFGFEVEVIENATQSEILNKIREYSQKEYKPMDQLFIFFAGHGTYDQTFGEGFVVTKESLVNDEAKTSYLSHNRLRSIINNIPSEHIFLTMDVCFGGTFDEELASARGMDEVYIEQQQSEYISRKLLSKTRIYLTSGGKTYVSDGIAGQHSPFARNFINSLNSKGGADGILTTSEIFGYVEKLKIQPILGSFGSNAPNSDFLFIVK